MTQNVRRTQPPQVALVFSVVGTQIPQNTAGIAHHGQAGRLHVLQQGLEQPAAPQHDPTLLAAGNVRRDVAENAASVL